MIGAMAMLLAPVPDVVSIPMATPDGEVGPMAPELMAVDTFTRLASANSVPLSIRLVGNRVMALVVG